MEKIRWKNKRNVVIIRLMIILDPSRGIKQATKINFNLLSQLLTTLLEANHKRKINIVAKVHKSRVAGTSMCWHVDEHEFQINLDISNTKKRYIFSSLLHELRHCIQINLFEYYWDTSSSMKTWREYWYSKEEVDARKMEKLTTQMIKAYDAMVVMNDQFKKYGLNKIA